MDKNDFLYYQSALALKLPAKLIAEIDGFRIKMGKHRLYFRGGITPFNNISSSCIAINKYCMNKLLESSGLPIPRAIAFHRKKFNEESLESLIKNLSFPLVVKPMKNTALGKDVLCNIDNMDQLNDYMKKCFQDHDFLSVEEFHPQLNAYRVLVYFNKVIGVVQRYPACVVGDGIHSIKELIEIHNVEREKFNAKVSLGPIKVDEEYQIRLNELQMTLDTIPKDKERVVLCYTCNSTRGGTMESLGAKICVENARLMCQAAKVLNLNIVGFDVLCEDINIPIVKSRGVIIEANCNPDITIHENPMYGTPNQVSKKILRRLIFRYPLTYLLGFYRYKQVRVCIKFSTLLLFILMAKYLGFGQVHV